MVKDKPSVSIEGILEDGSNLIEVPLSRKTLAQQVEEKIVNLLFSGKLKAGDKLPPEMELIEMLGVSRPVLREAMSSLGSLGVVTRKTRDGTYFAEKIGAKPYSTMLSIVHDNTEAIIEARMVLELGFVSFAAEKISDESLQKLKDTITAIDESDGDYGEYDIRFHRIIAESVENPILQGMIDSLILTHAKLNTKIKYREKEKTIKHHKAIYDALSKRDAVEAHKEMYNHLNFVREKILESEED